VKRTVQKFSRELFLILVAVGAQFPMLDAQATTILPAANNGTTVWTGNNLAALDAAQIAAIVGTPGLGLYYDAQFGKAQIATSGGANAQVVFQALQAGTVGNDISVQIVTAAGVNLPLSVNAIGRTIMVTLGTDGVGAATSTAAQVAAAVNAQPAASALVAASFGGSGTGVVQGLIAGLTPAIVETGLAGGYQTTFANSASFPEDATVTNTGGVIDASELFLYVRGSVSEPAYYIYDLFAPAFSWNGLDNLVLQDFWPNAGSIEQISIVGLRSTAVPEGSSWALLVLGLGMFAWSRGRARQRA
jgi:hypothetical protein